MRSLTHSLIKYTRSFQLTISGTASITVFVPGIAFVKRLRIRTERNDPTWFWAPLTHAETRANGGDGAAEDEGGERGDRRWRVAAAVASVLAGTSALAFAPETRKLLRVTVCNSVSRSRVPFRASTRSAWLRMRIDHDGTGGTRNKKSTWITYSWRRQAPLALVPRPFLCSPKFPLGANI